MSEDFGLDVTGRPGGMEAVVVVKEIRDGEMEGAKLWRFWNAGQELGIGSQLGISQSALDSRSRERCMFWRAEFCIDMFCVGLL